MCEYFTEMFNWIDMAGLFLTLFIVIMTILELEWVSFQQLRVMAAFASCFIMIKFFDWLRLFAGTSFYILLIEHTLKDVV